MKYLSGLSKHQLGWESFTLEIGLSKKTSHPLVLTIHKWLFHKWEKVYSHGLSLYFINIIGIIRFQIQVELVWLLMLCHVASLFTFPLLPNLSRSLLSFSNYQIRPLRWVMHSWNVIMSLFQHSYLTCVIIFIESPSLVS